MLGKRRNWILQISILTFCLSIVMGLLSDKILRSVGIIPAVLVLLIIIFIGITFDTIGIAVTTANDIPFHSMSSQNIRRGKYCVFLVKNAAPVAAFCNDVIGDISGIISGAATGIIVARMSVLNLSVMQFTLISAILTAIVAALTVGGKAYGKKIAIKYWKKIVLKVGTVVCFLDRYLHFPFFKGIA